MVRGGGILRVRMESLVVAERTWPTRLVFLRHLCIFLSSLAMCVSGLACVGIMREGGPAAPVRVCACFRVRRASLAASDIYLYRRERQPPNPRYADPLRKASRVTTGGVHAQDVETHTRYTPPPRPGPLHRQEQFTYSGARRENAKLAMRASDRGGSEAKPWNRTYTSRAYVSSLSSEASRGASAIIEKCESGNGAMYAFLTWSTAALRNASLPSPILQTAIGPSLLPSSS